MNLTKKAVVVALGSSLAGTFETSQALLEHCLADFPNFDLHVQRQSCWWESLAWPDATQPPYLNGIVFVETVLSPHQVMASLLGLERRFGRHRSAPNAPRTLDLDLIAYGRKIIASKSLTLPHPRAQDRYFVMGPLAEVAPEWEHPISRLSALALAVVAQVGRDARPMRQDSMGTWR